MISSVYFFCCPSGPPENTAYLHNVVALAEGLKELGITTLSNRNYWETETGYLLNESTIDFRDCDVVFVDAAYFDMGFSELLPTDLFNKNRQYKLVYNDNSDGLITNGHRPEIRNADIVLKSHYNRKYKKNYPTNFVPWQFGLTNRIINAVAPQSYEHREKKFLNNFRVYHPLRAMAEKKVAPLFRKVLQEDKSTNSFGDVTNMLTQDYSYWRQTGRRHYPTYYKRLSNSYACFSFGGNPQKKISNKKGLFWDILYKIDWKMPVFNYDRVYQFDSWRFWESLAAGCCTVHIDFDKYGIVLPEMPQNFVHYMGVDLNNIAALKTRIAEKNIFEEIGNSGRNWVLKNYSPQPVAERFLTLLA